MPRIRSIYKSKYFDGLVAELAHMAESHVLLQKVLDGFRPELIIEFGTMAGGLTLLFHEWNRDIPLYTYDKYTIIHHFRRTDIATMEDLENLNANGFNDNVKIFIQDILSEPVPEIVDLIQSDKRVLLYCDNGNKIQEVHMYAKYLKSGSLLGVHDWNREIKRSDIDKPLKAFEDHYMNIEFQDNKCLSRFFIKK